MNESGIRIVSRVLRNHSIDVWCGVDTYCRYLLTCMTICMLRLCLTKGSLKARSNNVLFWHLIKLSYVLSVDKVSTYLL